MSANTTVTLERPIPAALADQLAQAIARTLTAKRLQGHTNELFIHGEVDRDTYEQAAAVADTATRALLNLLHTHTDYAPQRKDI